MPKTQVPASPKRVRKAQIVETYIVLCQDDITLSTSDFNEAEDIARGAANVHRRNMQIFKLVETVKPDKLSTH